ncbi:MAG: PilZ domain-containing protein [Firmicutes bacterium HGW-Firmicutes-7]|nr:MAG: PilZ domain-containing protein [Firmicutes bacterium HGW-Firmicutes-7]
MEERRKHKRLPIFLQLEINKLFKQDNEIIENLEEDIEVINISKTGIGFLSKAQFPMEYYFNAKIEFDKTQFFYCVLKIIRKEEVEDAIFYGCEFVGLAEFLSKKVDEYEAILEDE